MPQAGVAGKKGTRIIRAVLFVAGAAFLLFGIFSGDCRRLFMKAIFICMECAGIG